MTKNILAAFCLGAIAACGSHATGIIPADVLDGPRACQPTSGDAAWVHEVAALQCIHSGQTLTLTPMVAEGDALVPRPEVTVELVQTSVDGPWECYARCHPGEKCPEEDGSYAEIDRSEGRLCVGLRCGEGTGPLGGHDFCVSEDDVRGGCMD